MRGRLGVLLLLLVAAAGTYFYSQRPLRFDGSSIEAFDDSSEEIFQALDPGEKPRMKKALKDLMAGLAMEDGELFSRAFQAGMTGSGKDAVEREIRDLLREKLDGKTVEDLYGLAEAARTKKDDMFDRGISGGGSSTPRKTPPPQNDLMWQTREELLAAAPQVELTTREIEVFDRKILIDLPKDATVKERYGDVRIYLATGERLDFRDYITDIKEYVRTNAERDYKGVDTIVYADDTVVIEKQHDDKGMQGHPYEPKINVILSEYRWIGADISKPNPDDVYGEPAKLQPVLLLLRCLSTIQLKEPEPTDPVELAKAPGIEVEPRDAASAEEVTGLEFTVSANASNVRVLKHFPNLKSLDVGCRLVTELGEDCPLAHCPHLTRLIHDEDIEPDTVDAIFGLSGLRELEVDLDRSLGLRSIETPGEWFAKFSQLSELEKLRVTVDRDEVDQLASLTSCQNLEDLYIECGLGRHPSGGLDFLARLPRLKRVRIGGRFPGELLHTLSRVKNLESLSLEMHELPGQQFRELAKCQSLKRLSLSINKWHVSHDDLATLSATPLEFFSVEHFGGGEFLLKDAQIIALTKVATLNELQLNIEGLTINALQELAELPNLKTLDLGWKVKIDAAKLEKFKTDHQDLDVD